MMPVNMLSHPSRFSLRFLRACIALLPLVCFTVDVLCVPTAGRSSRGVGWGPGRGVGQPKGEGDLKACRYGRHMAVRERKSMQRRAASTTYVAEGSVTSLLPWWAIVVRGERISACRYGSAARLSDVWLDRLQGTQARPRLASSRSSCLESRIWEQILLNTKDTYRHKHTTLTRRVLFLRFRCDREGAHPRPLRGGRSALLFSLAFRASCVVLGLLTGWI
jgi:hypothetical protein